MTLIYKRYKKKSATFFFLMLIAFSIAFQHVWLLNQFPSSEGTDTTNNDALNVHPSETDYYNTEWISNGDFSSGSSNWVSEVTGDSSDFNLAVSGGSANYGVQGNTGTFSLVENPLNNNSLGWHYINDPYFPSAAPPTSSSITPSGFKFQHYFREAYGQYTQLASRLWARDLTVSQNLSDYIITSASLTAYFNASVNYDIDVKGDSGLTYQQSYDFARFFLLLFDPDKNTVFEAGYYHIDQLGKDSGSNTMPDTALITFSSETLIYYLTSILNQDHQHFGIALGIRVYCEDNISPSDSDRWENLLFKRINLTFTYEKKINTQSTISWNQEAGVIPSNYIIENATLNFRYRIDKSWATNTGSYNSEFRILINTNQIGDTVKLTTATTSYQYFKTGGLDVSNFLSAGGDVNVSIQIYIGDEFTLDTSITISIDDVSLSIGYGIFTEPDTSIYNLLLNDVDRTGEKSTQVTYSENLNVTFIYKNSTEDFITGADVQLTGEGLSPIPLTENPTFEQYTTIIDTTDLGVGVSFLTLSASKRYHTSQEFQITVEVISRDTDIQLFLNDSNETDNKEIAIQWNENLNITIKYLDRDNVPSTHINGATVELTGAGPSKTLSEDPTHKQYEISINTTILGIGSTYLTVYASLQNYTSLNIRFKVTVNLRTTFIDNVKLNGISSTSLQVGWNELFDVSASYNDSITNAFINGATLQLIGPNYLQSLPQSGNEYIESINSSKFTIGNNFLTIFAQKDNYSITSELITITVIERSSNLEIYLDEVLRTAISLPYDEQLNITVVYEDTTGYFLDNAIVELRSGITTLYTLSQHPTYDQYYVTINTDQLDLGVNLLTIYAKKDNHTASLTSITIVVSERSTALDIYLDEVLRTAIAAPYDELLNITVVYEDATGYFLDNAVVELRSGITTLYTLSQHLTYDQYFLTINTNQLNLGVNLLSIYAKKDNYTVASSSITITVGERDTNLDIYLDEVLRTAISLPYDEQLNITVVYEDATGYFLNNAVVELRSGITTLYILSQHLSYDQYYLTINTNQLSLGVNSFAIYAKKDNFTAALASITITVNERATSLEVYLDEVSRTALTLSYGELLNITAVYEDATGYFLDSAIVEVRSGTTTLYTLSQHPTYDQYYLTINTNKLSLGANSFAIYAKKDNYSAALASISITVNERGTTLDIYLEETHTTSISIAYGESLNITAVYKDITNYFLDNAVVELRSGATTLYTLSQHSTYDQYYLTINTNQLSLGVNLLAIHAKKDNYTASLVSIVITVSERNTILDIYLEEMHTTSIAVAYGELLNITAIYEDITGYSLDNAVVELRSGPTILYILSYDGIHEQYYLNINTNQFSLGANLLSVYAKKDNYTAKLVSITITINERGTTLNVLLDGQNSNTFEFYNVSINEYVNITAIYEDITSIFLEDATLELTGQSIGTLSFTRHLTFDQYNLTLKAEDLGIGVHFLVVSAEKENYTSLIKNIKLNIRERRASLQLFVDNYNLTTLRYLSTEIDQTLNLTVTFRDYVDKNHLSGANIRVTGAFNDNFTEDTGYAQYELSLDSNDLGQGINFLTIFAQKEGYLSESILFTIEVVEKDSNLELFLNDFNKTLDKSIEVTVGDLINVTVHYQDYSGAFIDNANVILVGEGLSLNLTQHPLYNQYNVTVNSNDLNFGINFLTLYAQKVNYQPQTIIVKIEIIDKETDLHIFLNGMNKTMDRSITLPINKDLNITVNYLDIVTSGHILGATIQLVGEGLSLIFAEDAAHHQYSIVINTNQIDIGVRFLTIYAQRANYQSYSALLRIQVDRIKTNVSTDTGATIFNSRPGNDFRLKIKLFNLDFNQTILNATVRYTWAFGQGVLVDPDNDGTYEVTLSSLPEGTFTITISVYAGDDYEFDRFQITLSVIRPQEEVLLFQILTIAGIAAAVGIGTYLFAYQRVLKYPKQVRKIHKFKKKLKTAKSTGVDVRSRENIIGENYDQEIHQLEKQMKTKLSIKSVPNKIENQINASSENIESKDS
jgi:hypothetical protein